MREEQKTVMTLRQSAVHIARGYGIIRRMCPWYLTLSSIRGVLKAVQPLVAVVLSARILDELAGARHLPAIALYAGIAVGATFALRVSVSLLERTLSVTQNSLRDKMRILRGERHVRMDFEHVERRDVNELVAEMNAKENSSGLGLIRVFYQHGELAQALCGSIASAALFASMFTAGTPWGNSFITSHWSAALLAASVALPAAARFLLMKRSLTMMADVFKLIPITNTTFGYYRRYLETTGAGKDVRVYRQQPAIAALLRRDTDKWYVMMSRMTSRTSGYTAAANAVVGGLAYVVIGLRALAGMYGVGQVTQYVGAVTAFSGSVTSLISTAAMMWENAAYLPLLYEYLDLPSVKYQGKLTTEKRADNDYQIEFRDVSFRYPGSDTYSLRHLNLKLNIGEKLAVVGMNGSGKTTMIKLLCRLYDPTEGTITLNGIDIAKYRYEEYLALFSVVFQDFQLLGFPLGQNVAASETVNENRVRDAFAKIGFDARARELSQGLDTHLGKRFDESGVSFSGGEEQKIALARAIYKDAPFVVLDEPTAALDPLAEYEIYSKFDTIVSGKTAVYISHRLSSCRFCNDIAVFHEGELIQRGSHEQLLADERGKYHELWHAQARHYAEQTA